MPQSSLCRLLTTFTHTLQAAGVDSPRLSSELILAESLGISREDFLKTLLLSPRLSLTEAQATRAHTLLRRREHGEPVAYLLGRKEFYGRDFFVTKDTLIPRPETELLIDTALSHIRIAAAAGAPVTTFADFGTGSGCIAVTTALEAPGLRGLALDRSPAALAVAGRNARKLDARGLTFARADFTCPPLQAESLDLLLSNPPYVSGAEYAETSPEVRDYEPASALIPRIPPEQPFSPGQASRTGLEDILPLIACAGVLLRPGGLLLMEIGHGQADAVLKATATRPWREHRVLSDLAGLPRLLWVKKR